MTEVVVSQTLKPCPFCGADQDRLAVSSTHLDSLRIHSVECRDCGVEVADDDSLVDAIAHWNTRTLTPAQAAGPVLLEALKAWIRLFDPAALVEDDVGDSKYADAARLTYAAIAQAEGPQA